MQKEYSDLTFTDDFMFCKILTANPKLCQELLELILDIKIKKIVYTESQKTIDETYDGKGIRLDVYVNDEAGTVYDLEMQTTMQKDLPKRTRYYQGMIDLNLIEKGEKYSALKKSYIIFICLSDPFGKNLPVYSFRNICIQDSSVELGDDSHKIIINAAGSREGLSEEMKDFLDFLQKKGAKSSLTKELQQAVGDAIMHKNWEVEFMTLNRKIQEEREDARQEERKSMINFMLSSGKSPEKISEFTGISMEEIKKVEEEMLTNA